MPLVGSFIYPHGAITLNKEVPNIPPTAHKLHDAMREASKQIQELKPDIIFLTTPHGISLNEAYVVYGNAKAAGTAEWEGQWQEYFCEVDIHEKSASLCEYLVSQESHRNIKTELVTVYAPQLTAPLRWGEVIPIYFVQQQYKSSKAEGPKYIIFSMPRKRLEKAAEMVPDLYQIGEDLYEYFQGLQERVVVLISGDLAHTHPHNLEHHPHPFGVHSDAQIFDDLIEHWCRTLDKETLHTEAAKYVNTAIPCGFTGFVALSGLLSVGQKKMGS